MKMAVAGTFHGVENVGVGDVVTVSDDEGVRYCKLGYAEPVAEDPDEGVETATPPEPEKRTATRAKPPAARKKS
jgi:hypothetical protein